VAGGLLAAWSAHRRLLALETGLQATLTGFSDRLNELERITTRDIKREAAATRWGKGKAADEALVRQIREAGPETALATAGHPWDPRTWGATR
jgi:hypothetical protein